MKIYYIMAFIGAAGKKRSERIFIQLKIGNPEWPSSAFSVLNRVPNKNHKISLSAASSYIQAFKSKQNESQDERANIVGSPWLYIW